MIAQNLPVTLAVSNPAEQERLVKWLTAMPGVSLLSDDSDETGLLIYEAGDTAADDMAHIVEALEGGSLPGAILVGSSPSPEVLMEAMRAGIREFLPYPLDKADFQAAMARCRNRLVPEPEPGELGRIITVVACRAGLGTTTLATSLAQEINAMAPGSTVLVDMRQPFGDVPFFLNMDTEYTWGDLVSNVSRLDDTFLAAALSSTEDGLDLLAAPKKEGRPDPQAMHLVLQRLRAAKAVTVIDTAWDPEVGPTPEMSDADDLLFLIQPSLTCLAHARRILESIRAEHPELLDRLRMVLTRAVAGTGIEPAEVAEVLELKQEYELPEDMKSTLSALNQGRPITEVAPRSVYARSVKAMASKLNPSQKTAKRRFFGLFGSKEK